MYQVIADGQPWQDADGNDQWPLTEAAALAGSLEAIGYTVQIAPA